MKTIKFLAIAAIAIMMASCGGSKSSETSGQLTIDLNDTTTQVTSDEQNSLEASESMEDSSAEESAEDEDVTSDAGSSSEDWDALLRSYEQYVDKYVSLVKKAANGDMSAMAEYPELMEKAQEFADKMENAKDDMSASQWARYMKITSKMTQAAAAMR